MSDDSTCFGMSHVGLKRETNQDQFLIATLNKSMWIRQSSLPVEDSERRRYGASQGQLLFVADGMGGHAGGERASLLAIQTLVDQFLNDIHWFFKPDEDAEQEFIQSLKQILHHAHQEIQAEGRQDGRLRGMGTTLTMTYMVWPKLYVLHAGDSRCYLVRGGEVMQLTTDHTLAQRLVSSGGLKPDEALHSRFNHVLWNVLGGFSQGSITAEVRSLDLQPDDVIVLCSDGVHRYLTPESLLSLLANSSQPKELCEALIALALDGGGDDNATVIVSKPKPPLGYASTVVTAANSIREPSTTNDDGILGE